MVDYVTRNHNQVNSSAQVKNFNSPEKATTNYGLRRFPGHLSQTFSASCTLNQLSSVYVLCA